MALPKIEQPIYFMPRMEQLPTLPKLPRMDRMESMPQLPRLPSLPQQTRQHEYVLPKISPLQAEVDARMDYAFNYDNPNEVNSYADVIMRTLTNVYDNFKNDKPVAETLSGFIDDSFQLLYRGTVQPVMNKDWAMLFRNQFLNFQETVDLVDNIWKGFAIGGDLSLIRGTFDWEGAKEGVRKSIVDRVNYDWDTGSTLKNLALEMATPTNLALLISGLGVGAVGKTALKESGETVAVDTAKQLAKNYRGSIEDAIKALGRNFTQAELTSLRNVARHIPDLQLLKSVNQVRGAINFVDSIGPSIAWGATVKLPWKIIQATAGVPTSIARYYATAVEEVMSKYPDDGLISTLAAKPELEIVLKELNQAQRLIGEPEVLIANDTLIAAAANSDNIKLKNLFQEFYKTYDDKKLLQQYMDDLFNTTGEVQAFDLAQKAYRDKTFAEFTERLDSFARAASGDTYKTFDEYINLVTSLDAVTNGSKGLTALRETVQGLEVHMNARFVYSAQETLEGMVKQTKNLLDDVLGKADLEVRLKYAEELKEYDYAIRSLTDYRDSLPVTPLQDLEYAEQTLKTLTQGKDVATTIKTIEDSMEVIKKNRGKAYSNFQSAKKAGKVFDPKPYDKELNRLQRNLNRVIEANESYNLLKATRDEQLAKATSVSENITKLELERRNLKPSVRELDTDVTIQLLQETRDSFKETLTSAPLNETQTKLLTRAETFIDQTIEELITETLKLKQPKADLNYDSVFETIELRLQNLINNVFAESTPDINLKKLSDRMYGKDIRAFANDTLELLETKYKKTAPNTFQQSFEKTFIKEGVVQHQKYNDFINSIEETLKGFDEDMFRQLGEYKNVSPTFEGVSFELANSADRVQDMLEAMKVNNSLVLSGHADKLDTTLAETLAEELYNIKYSVDRTIKELTLTIDETKSVLTPLERRVVIEKLQPISDSIADIQETIGLTADVLVEWTKDVMQSYNLKFNATLKNLYLLQNEDLTSLLDIVASENYRQMPLLESLEAMSRYNLENLKPLRDALQTGDLDAIQSQYFEIYNKAFDPTKVNAEDLLTTVQTILDVQESAEVMMDTLTGMVSVKQFYDSVQTAVDAGLDENVASTFIDAIQRTYDRPASLVHLSELAENPRALDLEYKNIMDNMEMQLRNLSIDKNVRLENWGEWLRSSGKLSSEELEQYYNIFGKENVAHSAGADAYTTYMVHKNILKDEFDPMVKHIYTDIESSGTSLETSVHYQISAVIPESNVYRTYFNTGVIGPKDMPHEDAVYHLLFGDSENRLLSLDQLKNDFLDVYQKGNAETLAKYYGLEIAEDKMVDGVLGKVRSITFKNSPQEFIFMPSEAALLAEYNAYVKTQKPPGGKLKYRMYNGLEYDLPLMNNRARLLDVEDFNIGAHLVEDTKVLLEDSLGIRRLTVQERATIEDLVYQHIVRRNQELSVMGNRRGKPGVTKMLDENLTKFLPTLDMNFTQAYEKLLNAFNPEVHQNVTSKAARLPSEVVGEFDKLTNQFTGGHDFFKDLNETMQSFTDDLRSFGVMDQRLKQFKVTVNANDFATGGRILPDDFLKGVPDILDANHIGVDMVTFNTHNGIYVPIIAPKKDIFPNLVYEYFDTGDVLVSDNAMRRMTELAGSVQRTMSYIRNPHLIDSFDINALHELHDILLETIRTEVGKNNFTGVIADLKKGDTPLRSFATTYELFKVYNRMANGVIAQVPDSMGVYRYPFITELLENEKFSEIVSAMNNPKELFKNVLREFGMDDKFYELPAMSEDMEKMFEFLSDVTNKGIKTLEQLETVSDKLKFARLKRVAPTYRYMLESFEKFQEAVNKTADYIEHSINSGVLKETPTLKKATARSAAFSIVRNMSECFDAVIAYNKLEQVVTMKPEEMASFIRHQGKGLIIFNNINLYSSTYFPQRGLTKMTDVLEDRNLGGAFEELIKNKKALEELGLGINVDIDWTAIYIKDWDKVVDLKYKPITTDFNMDEWLELIINTSLNDAGEIGEHLRSIAYDDNAKAMKALYESRKHLIGLAPDGGTSTLEYLDDIAMQKIVDKFQDRLPGMVDVQTLIENGVFDGNFFNHSVLGHIDGRRKVMDFISFNPAKTMYHTTDMLEKHLGSQVQLLELVRTPEFMLKNLLTENGGMTKVEMLEYLQQSPHLKVAFLNDKTASDGIQQFRLASVNIKNMKDLDFAIRMNATILDPTTYNIAYGAINNYKISNPFLRFLDQAFVRPFKMGWLAWNYGTVVRNVMDAGTKNIVSTKDAAIVPAMLETTRDYFRYKNTLTEIYEYASKQKIHPEVAIEEYFSKTVNPRLSRDTFNMIAEYVKMGGDMNQSKEIMEYYGDSISKMYKRIGQENSGLSADDFRHMMRLPDDIAEQWLKEKFPTDLDRVRTIMNAKGDLLTYKRAYQMHKLYKGNDISVDNFITYLKSGRHTPGQEGIMQELLDKTAHIRLEDDMITKLYNHPLLANSLDWNSTVEDIMRLSLYRYLKDTGANNFKAMHEVIRTHYDYSHKSRAQLYLEMLMPFSTFRTLSLQYWVDELSKSHQGVELLTRGWEAMAGFKEHRPEDVMIRRSLRYQMFTGNLILNDETGFTAKLNPSAMDMMGFFLSPVDYVEENLHSGINTVKSLFELEPYANESEEDFLYRKHTLAWNLVPLVGTHINKLRNAVKNSKDEEDTLLPGKFLMNLLMSPLFNTSWTPEQGGSWQDYNYEPWLPGQRFFRFSQYQRRPYSTRQYYRRTYPKRYYDKKTYPKYNRSHTYLSGGFKDRSHYSSFARTYNRSVIKFRRGSAYPTKASRSLNYAFSSVWRRSMTKAGNPKYKFLGFPTNKWTLQLKVNILRNITSYNRWQ